MRTLASSWSTAGSDTISYHTRRNSFMLPSLFIKYNPTDWISLRYAKTNTLTRPDYSAIIPLYNIDGLSQTVVYRNPFLEAGRSSNNDYVLSFVNNYLNIYKSNPVNQFLNAEEIKINQIKYDKYSFEKDPADKLFKSFFGEKWTKKFINKFLFTLNNEIIH